MEASFQCFLAERLLFSGGTGLRHSGLVFSAACKILQRFSKCISNSVINPTK